jgi:peptide/nickel transport system ATP-binding protein
MAAMALITDPAVVVFDEPTTALDVTTQIEVLAAFKKVIRELGTTAVYVSHDLAVVAQMADRIVVLNGGKVRENGVTAQVLDAPADEYTRQLLAATRHPDPDPVVAAPEASVPLLEIRHLSAGYGRVGSNGLPAVRVLDDVSLKIARGSALGVIGESGSGKTTLARVVAGLVDRASGDVLLDGKSLPA